MIILLLSIRQFHGLWWVYKWFGGSFRSISRQFIPDLELPVCPRSIAHKRYAIHHHQRQFPPCACSQHLSPRCNRKTFSPHASWRTMIHQCRQQCAAHRFVHSVAGTWWEALPWTPDEVATQVTWWHCNSVELLWTSGFQSWIQFMSLDCAHRCLVVFLGGVWLHVQYFHESIVCRIYNRQTHVIPVTVQSFRNRCYSWDWVSCTAELAEHESQSSKGLWLADLPDRARNVG